MPDRLDERQTMTEPQRDICLFGRSGTGNLETLLGEAQVYSQQRLARCQLLSPLAGAKQGQTCAESPVIDVASDSAEP